MNMLSSKDNFENCADEILVDAQDSLNDMLTSINSIVGKMKNRAVLTLPFGHDKISNAIKNFEAR